MQAAMKKKPVWRYLIVRKTRREKFMLTWNTIITVCRVLFFLRLGLVLFGRVLGRFPLEKFLRKLGLAARSMKSFLHVDWNRRLMRRSKLCLFKVYLIFCTSKYLSFTSVFNIKRR